MKKEILAAAIATTMLMGAKAMADNHGGDSKDSQKQYKKKEGSCNGEGSCKGEGKCEGKEKKDGEKCGGPGGCGDKE